jgi:hypothetical protein
VCAKSSQAEACACNPDEPTAAERALLALSPAQRVRLVTAFYARHNPAKPAGQDRKGPGEEAVCTDTGAEMEMGSGGIKGATA